MKSLRLTILAALIWLGFACWTQEINWHIASVVLVSCAAADLIMVPSRRAQARR